MLPLHHPGFICWKLDALFWLFCPRGNCSMCTPSLAMSPLAKLAATPLLIYLGTYPKHGTKTLLRNNWVKKMPAGHSEHILGHTDIHRSSGSNTRRKNEKNLKKKSPAQSRKDKTRRTPALVYSFSLEKGRVLRDGRTGVRTDGMGSGWAPYISLFP